MSKPTFSTNDPKNSAKQAITTEAQQIASSLEKGVPPSNEQITGILETTQQFLQEKQQQQQQKEEAEPLSEQACKVVSDLSQVLQDTKELIQKKNPDEAIQKTLLHAKAAGEAFLEQTEDNQKQKEQIKEEFKEKKDQISQQANELFRISTGLAKDLVSSAPFRQMLVDLIEITEKIFWRVSDKIQEEKEKEEKEEKETSFPTSTSTNTSSYVSFSTPFNPPSELPGLRQTSTATPPYSSSLQQFSFGETPTPAPTPTPSRTSSEENTSSRLTQALKQDVSQVENPAQQGLPQTTQAVKELGEKIKFVLREEQLTPEESKTLRKRLRDVLLKLKENPEFQQSLEYLLSLFNYMRPENIKKAAHSSETQYNFTMMTKEAKKFLSRFGDKTAIDRFSNNLDSFLNQIEKDSEEFDQLFQEMGNLFHQGLENPNILVENQQFIDQFDELQKKIRTKLSQFTDNTSISEINQDAKLILQSISEDPLSKNLSTDMEILVQDFFQEDEHGKLSLNLELLSELRKLLVPLLTEHLKWIPLPRVEGSDETYDYWFDDIVFSAPDVVPDQIKIQIASEGELDFKNLQMEQFQTLIKASCFGVKTTIKEMSFWFHRKTFPTTEDQGRATLEITGDGTQIDLIISVSQGKTPFKVHKINVSIDSLSLQIAETRHDFLYNVIAFFLKGAIKSKLENEIHDALYKGATFINRKLNQIAYRTYIQATTTAQATVLPMLGVDQKALELKQQQQKQEKILKTELHKE